LSAKWQAPNSTLPERALIEESNETVGNRIQDTYLGIGPLQSLPLEMWGNLFQIIICVRAKHALPQ
jgi:hypothetical protein